ncbi:MAG: phosphatidylglycerol lysyltransferase domain-containing protein [bacterium]|nr:phosphatidylglycerol lysyltransferase domain-containing protein [bacterium]
MKRRPALVLLIAMITLGSGLVNLFSLIGPSLPSRMEILQDVFPMEFIRLSKFLILISGFALVISALNIFKQKRRAFLFVLLIACLSIVFHLTKGLDYEEATVSFILLITLVLTRRHFTVKSSIPSLRLGMIRFAIAAFLAIVYGTTGFWFVEHHHFHINFNVIDSIQETFRYLFLVGDPNLLPLTHYARWFLDSLYLTTIIAIVLAISAFFRPVIFIFRDRPRDMETAKKIIEEHGRSALDYFKYAPDKSYFFSESRRSVIAYGVSKNFAITLADPVGPEHEIPEIIDDFAEFCRENDWNLGFHETLPDFLPIYESRGFKKLKMGDEAIVDLSSFSLDSKESKQFRQILRKLEDSGIVFKQLPESLSEPELEGLSDVSENWLRLSGRRERRFTVGMFDRDYVRSTPVFVAIDSDGVVQAFVNLIPSYCKGESTIDLMRRRSTAPNGIMDYLFIKLMLYLKEQGFTRFNLGLAPMSGFTEGENAGPEEKAIHFFFQNLDFLFSFKGLLHYKAKFATFWEPRYTIYRSALDLPKIAIVLRDLTEIRGRQEGSSNQSVTN